MRSFAKLHGPTLELITLAASRAFAGSKNSFTVRSVGRALLLVLLSFMTQVLTACGPMTSPETDPSAQLRGSRPEANMASPRPATVGSSLMLSSGAVVSTTPAANATQVRPDTEIGLQLDLSEAGFRALDKKFQRNAMLVLLNDGGQAVFSTASDSELRYDAASGRLTLTLPEPLERYTTYGVIITSNELPGILRQDGLGSKRMPKRPDFIVEELDPESFIRETQAEVARKMEESRTGLSEAQLQDDAVSEGVPAQVQEQ